MKDTDQGLALMPIVQLLPGSLKRSLAIVRSVSQAMRELRESVPASSVTKTTRPLFQDFCLKWWRHWVLWGFELSFERNNLILTNGYYYYLVKDFIDRKDWHGLNNHLLQLRDKKSVESAWKFCMGLCSMHLNKWEEAGKHLNQCLDQVSDDAQLNVNIMALFGFCGPNTVRFQTLKRLLAFQYGASSPYTGDATLATNL